MARVSREPAETSKTSASEDSVPGPPPLRPFGLVLHHEETWTHEGQPIRNRKLRRAFDRSVRYLPDEDMFVVQLGRFRGQIEVEEAAFFVTEIDVDEGRLRLSDGSLERLDVASLELSDRDGALLCRVKRALVSGGLWARFRHSAQAELLAGAEALGDGFGVRIAGRFENLPDRVVV